MRLPVGEGIAGAANLQRWAAEEYLQKSVYIICCLSQYEI
jgi:hypothetical protein